MRCFNSGKPQLDASDKTQADKSKTLFFHNKNQFSLGKKSNSDKTICYDQTSISQVHDYSTYLSLNYGQSLCDDCDDAATQTPNPDTEYGPNTLLTLTGENLFDLSCNVFIDSSCNHDMIYDSSTMSRSGWSIPAVGVSSVIDPNNIIVGEQKDCDQKKFLNKVTMPGIDLSGNITQDGYLRFFQFPQKINLQ